jgi:osmotically-inducible protein OsmY
MKLWKGIACSLALLCFGAKAPQSLAAARTSSGYTDVELENTLRNSLNRNPALGRVEPSIVHGTVTLTGEVPHYQDKLDAEAIAHQLPGVRTVHDQISIKALVVDDRELEDRIEGRLRFARADIGLTFPQIQVKAHRGVVSLSGSVRDVIEHAAALSLVGSTDGVLTVKDGLSIDPAFLHDEATRVRINKAVYRAARADGEIGLGGATPVRATLTDGTVTLMGAVSNVKTKDELLSRVRDASGVVSVDDEVVVRNAKPTIEDSTFHPLAPCVQNKEVASASH